jgi:hypothetical protein
VVGVCGVQSHLRAEPAQPTEQGVSAPLRSGRSCPQDLEAGMMQKKSSGVQPHYLDVWLPAHNSDADVADNLVSNNIKCYA